MTEKSIDLKEKEACVKKSIRQITYFQNDFIYIVYGKNVESYKEKKTKREKSTLDSAGNKFPRTVFDSDYFYIWNPQYHFVEPAAISDLLYDAETVCSGAYKWGWNADCI